MSIRVFDEESSTESKSNLAMKEISVVVANIDRFGPATNVFLESPAANGIAGFMFSEMHVKEQGLVKLRSKFALQVRSPQRVSLSCHKLGRVTVAQHCSGPTSFAPFRLHPARSCGACVCPWKHGYLFWQQSETDGGSVGCKSSNC